MRFAHHMVHVRDLEGAIAFYCDVLGGHVRDRHDYDGTTLVYLGGFTPDIEIELIAPAQWTFATRPEAGRTHIAFAVDHLEVEHQRLARLGVAAGPITPYVANGALQTRYFYFYDPDGNEIEFLEPRGRYAEEREAT